MIKSCKLNIGRRNYEDSAPAWLYLNTATVQRLQYILFFHLLALERYRVLNFTQQLINQRASLGQ